MAIARSTDPMTSRLAKTSDTLEARILGILITQGPKYCWELVKILNEQRESYSHDPDNPPREITIDSVSTCMRPMARLGEVHEHGKTENLVRGTGNDVIVWAAGPAEGWTPGSSMPKRQTGPRNKKLIPDLNFNLFLPSELRPKLAEFTSVEQLATWLNEELVKRAVLSFD